MKCFNCGKEFIVKRDFYTLFDTTKYKVCDQCLRDNPIQLDFSLIPLNNYTLEVVSLFKKKGIKNYQAFKSEYDKIYDTLISTRRDALILKYENFKLNEDNKNYLERLALKEKKNLLVLTFLFQSDC